MPCPTFTAHMPGSAFCTCGHHTSDHSTPNENLKRPCTICALEKEVLDALPQSWYLAHMPTTHEGDAHMITSATIHAMRILADALDYAGIDNRPLIEERATQLVAYAHYMMPFQSEVLAEVYRLLEVL